MESIFKVHAMINLHEILTNLFEKAIKIAYPNLEVIHPAISTGGKFADYQFNDAMQICKLLKAKGKAISLKFIITLFNLKFINYNN